MSTKRNAAATVFSIALLVAPQAYSQHINQRNGVRRVLLISIDGMHAVDYELREWGILSDLSRARTKRRELYAHLHLETIRFGPWVDGSGHRWFAQNGGRIL